MRIVGTIQHPQMKISIFKMENRYSVKFENALYEQTYKLGDSERFDTEGAVRNLIDGDFMDQVLQTFQSMHQTRLQGLARNFPASTEAMFEDII